MVYRSNWFDLEEWNRQGLKISTTTNNEAVKLYDAALTQFACWYDDPALGGMANTLKKLNDTDPNFLLAKTLALGTQLLKYDGSYYDNAQIKQTVDDMDKEIERKKEEITRREMLHVRAIQQFARLDWNGASRIWSEILNEYPNDMQALKFNFYNYFFSGQKQKQYELMASTHPHFSKETNPFYGFVDGLLAFGLEEIGRYEEAEKYAKLALEKNPHDGWAAHSLAHVFEMNGRFETGIEYMTSKEKFWITSNHLACHNYWHLALFNISADRFNDAVAIFDGEIFPRMQESKAPFLITDASSLLYRLALQNYDANLKSKYQDVFAVTKPYMGKHILGFNDVHFSMACLGSGNRSEAQDFLESIKNSEYMKTQEKQAKLAAKLMEAMIEFDGKNFEKSTDIMLSIKDSIVSIGGSDAQRDVFNQMMLVSAMKSPKESHSKILKELILERENFKKNDTFIKQCTGKFNQQQSFV